MDSIMTATREAAGAAGLKEPDLRHGYAGWGLAGAVLRSACDRLLAIPHPFATVTIETDAFAAWLGAHGGEDGAILILGTGTCGLAVVGGRQNYVSGWGAEVSDEASGQAMGREAVRRALWAYDGRAPRTALAEAILQQFNNNAEAIVAFATEARPADYAKFVPLVFDQAARLDPLAVALVTSAAADASRIIERLLDLGAPSVCLLGGLAARILPWLPPPVRERLSAPKGDALDGAIRMARKSYAEAVGSAAQSDVNR
jgi:glucosamine kinase